MKSIQPSFTIIENSNEFPFLKEIERAARTCYKSEEKTSVDETSAMKLVASLIKSDHLPMLEFGPDIVVSIPVVVYEAFSRGCFKYLTFTNYDKCIVSGSVRAWYEAYTQLTNDPFTRNSICAVIGAACQMYPDLDIIYKSLFKVDLAFSDITPGVPVIVPDLSLLSETELYYHGWETVLFVCDRGVTHEIVRHRPPSYAQESTRYCNYSKGKYASQITVIEIEGIMKLEIGKTYIHPETKESIIVTADMVESWYDHWTEAMSDAEYHYLEMTKTLCPAQLARSVLPNSLKTEINMKAKISEWDHFFYRRVSPKAHPQMRQLALPLHKIFFEKYPTIDNLSTFYA